MTDDSRRARRTFASAAPVLGGLFGVFCPACIPALAVFLPTIGLGFLANLVVDRTLLLVFVALALLGLHISALAHHRSTPFMLGLVSAFALIAGRNFILDPWLIRVSSAGLILAAVLDVWYRRRTPTLTCAPARGTT